MSEQKQTGYAAVTVNVDQGNLTGDQLRGLAKLSATAGDGLLRTAINQNLVLAFIPLARLPQVHAALARTRPRRRRAPARSTTCSPAPAPTPATWASPRP